jgi:Nitrous oxide-stimulated promoter
MNLAREKKTVRVMVGMYCRAHHPGGPRPCAECSSLLDYALRRIERCRFAAAKPVCSKCRVHCYQAERREAIRQVMRYAGPRMLLSHPLLALRHLEEARRSAPIAQK